MNTLTFINLFCIPINAYIAGTCETHVAKAINIGACAINLAIIAAKLS